MALHFLFAHGAGAPSSSAWMLRFAGYLGEVGSVRRFDYPYARSGPGAAPRKAPDKLDVLIAAHKHELEELRRNVAPDDRIVLAGKSMGSRVGCHVALEEPVRGLVCFGYPLRGQNGKLRDEVLLALRVPVLFVQGTRDALCPLGELERVRAQMASRSELFIVQGGDHSLKASQAALKAEARTQPDVEMDILLAVRRFCETL